MLHIAKCLSGEKRFAALNIPRLRIEHESGDIEDITSSRDAVERTLSLIPVPASIIDGHLIVDQDSITAPVASSSARFKETIHTLTRTDELETMRGHIRDIMAGVTIPEVEEHLQQANADVNMDLGEISRLESIIEQLTNDAEALKILTVNARLDELEGLKKASDRRKRLELELETLAKDILQLNINLNSLLAKKAAAEGKLVELKESYEQSKEIVYSAPALLKQCAKVKALTASKQEMMASLNKLQNAQPKMPEFENPTEQQIEEATNASNAAWQELTATEKKIELAEAGQCPECGNDTAVCEADLEKLKTKAEDCRSLKNEIDSLIVTMKFNSRTWNTYTAESQKWLNSAETLTNKIEEISTELASMEDVADIDEAYVAKHKAIVDDYEATNKALATIENQIAATSTSKANTETAQKARVDELATLPAENFDEFEHARLTKIVNDHLALRMKISESSGSLENSRKSLERSLSRLNAFKEKAAQVEPTRRFRKILERASMALTKDGLPKYLSLQYMGKLNERIKFYLNMIHADFTAYIDDNLDFIARKADGLTHKANRLSGGQKQQASVSYLLAVNDVFASTLGILALDEPSGAMQESNSQELAEAFSYLAKVGKQTGRQFIVITHSAALAAYACKHITLEGQ